MRFLAFSGTPAWPGVLYRRYLHSFKVQKLKVDKLLCWAKHCRFINGKSNLWPQEPKIFFPKPVETSLNRTATTAAFLSAFGGVPDRILCLGDLFDGHAYFADAPPGFHHGLLDSWHAPGQLADGQELSGQVAGRAAGAGSGAGAGVEGGSSGAPGECRALIWPNEMVLSSARGFVQEVRRCFWLLAASLFECALASDCASYRTFYCAHYDARACACDCSC